MLVPMSPTSSLFLLAESREHPMHVGGLQLFQPPDGADSHDVAALFDDMIAAPDVAPVFQKRARRSVTSLGQWGWEMDKQFDLEHHVRKNALPQPARVRELLTLVSRLHSTLLDRHRPLWEMHLVEGLDDGRFAVYTKTHHALMDGVSALRMLSKMLTTDPDDLEVPPPWAPRQRRPKTKEARDRQPAGRCGPRRAVGRRRRGRPRARAGAQCRARPQRAGRDDVVLGAQDDVQRARDGGATLRCAVLAAGPDPPGRQGRGRDRQRRGARYVCGRACAPTSSAMTRCRMRR